MYDQILIELREVRREQLEQGKLLTRVDERTLGMDDKLDSHITSDDDLHKDIERRMRPLERAKIRIAALIAVVAFLGSIFVDVAKEAFAAAFLPPH